MPQPAPAIREKADSYARGQLTAAELLGWLQERASFAKRFEDPLEVNLWAVVDDVLYERMTEGDARAEIADLVDEPVSESEALLGVDLHPAKA